MEGSSMTGIALMIFVFIWGLIALLLSKMLWKLIGSFKRRLQLENSAENSSRQHSISLLLQIALAVLIFVLPLADEIIAYPKYYQLCSEAGSFQFGPGMDAHKAHGREVYQVYDHEYLILFPQFRSLLASEIPQYQNVSKKSGVIVEKRLFRYIDTSTGELVLSNKSFNPVSSFFAIRWDGNKIPWLLKECGSHGTTKGRPSQDFYRDLQLIEGDAPINFNTLNSKAE